MTTGLNSTGLSLNGSTGMRVVQTYLIKDAYGTAIGNGDPVCFGTSGDAGYIVSCPETARPIGVLRGIRYVNALGEVVRANSFTAGLSNAGTLDGFTDIVAEVEMIENSLFYIEAADAAVTQADIGTTKRLKNVGRNATTGRSTAQVDMDATVSTETRLVRIHGLFPSPNAALGTGVDLLVSIV